MPEKEKNTMFEATARIKNTELIGVVTVLFNADAVLPGFFRSLAQQRGVRYRLFVIDNSETDSGSRLCRELVKQYSIDAEIIFNNANVGVARGNNQGIEKALRYGCTQVLLANNDTEFGPDTFHLLQRALIKNYDLVVTPKIMYHDEPTRLWYGGGHINAWLMRTPHYGMGQVDRGQFDSSTHVSYAPTCFMLLSSRVFKVVGQMDEQYFVYYDDTDFVWRMTASNIFIRYEPAAVVLHKVSSSTGGDRSPFSVYYTNRNRVYFIRKNLRGIQKVFALGYFLLTRIIQFVKMPHQLARRGLDGVIDGIKMNMKNSL